jgi:hypothetical protein
MRQNRENLQGQERQEGLGQEQLERTQVNKPGQQGLEREEVSHENLPLEKEQGQKEQSTERSDRRL